MGQVKIFHIGHDSGDIDFFAAAIGNLSGVISCFSFTNASKALEKTAGGGLIPDIIFPHLNRPVVYGQEFSGALKADPLKDIPAIILCASPDSVTAEKFKAEVAGGFLTNPASIKDLSNLPSPYLI